MRPGGVQRRRAPGLAVHAQAAGPELVRQPGQERAVAAHRGAHQRRDSQPILPLGAQFDQPFDQFVFAEQAVGGAALGAVTPAEARVKQAQERVQARGAGHGGGRVAVQQILAHGHCRSQPLDLAHQGGRQAALRRAEREHVHEAPARLMIQRVEGQRGLAGAGDARHHRQPPADLDVHVLQVMLARPADRDGHRVPRFP